MPTTTTAAIRMALLLIRALLASSSSSPARSGLVAAFQSAPRLPLSAMTAYRYRPTSASVAMMAERVPTLEEWRIDGVGCVVGQVSNHPTFKDGDTITTSPLKNYRIIAAAVKDGVMVATQSGCKYKLGRSLEHAIEIQRVAKALLEARLAEERMVAAKKSKAERTARTLLATRLEMERKARLEARLAEERRISAMRSEQTARALLATRLALERKARLEARLAELRRVKELKVAEEVVRLAADMARLAEEKRICEIKTAEEVLIAAERAAAVKREATEHEAAKRAAAAAAAAEEEERLRAEAKAAAEEEARKEAAAKAAAEAAAKRFEEERIAAETAAAGADEARLAEENRIFEEKAPGEALLAAEESELAKGIAEVKALAEAEVKRLQEEERIAAEKVAAAEREAAAVADAKKAEQTARALLAARLQMDQTLRRLEVNDGKSREETKIEEGVTVGSAALDEALFDAKKAAQTALLATHLEMEQNSNVGANTAKKHDVMTLQAEHAASNFDSIADAAASTEEGATTVITYLDFLASGDKQPSPEGSAPVASHLDRISFSGAFGAVTSYLDGLSTGGQAPMQKAMCSYLDTLSTGTVVTANSEADIALHPFTFDAGKAVTADLSDSGLESYEEVVAEDSATSKEGIYDADNAEKTARAELAAHLEMELNAGVAANVAKLQDDTVVQSDNAASCLDSISDVVSPTEEGTTAISNYLDLLSSTKTLPSPERSAAITSYLDTISFAGASVSPSTSASAVTSYLDGLSKCAAQAPTPKSTGSYLDALSTSTDVTPNSKAEITPYLSTFKTGEAEYTADRTQEVATVQAPSTALPPRDGLLLP